jgi:hypothetical protein
VLNSKTITDEQLVELTVRAQRGDTARVLLEKLFVFLNGNMDLSNTEIFKNLTTDVGHYLLVAGPVDMQKYLDEVI